MFDEANPGHGHPTASKADQAKRARDLLESEPGLSVQDACSRAGVSIHTYYRHHPNSAVGKWQKKTRATKVPKAKVGDAIPTGAVTMRVSAPVDHCPPGYVRVMVKREDLAKIIMLGGV